MSNIVDFLEMFGCDARLRHMSDQELNEALALAGIDPQVRTAVVGRDQAALEALLGAATNVCCLINKPDDEEDEEEEEDEEDENDEARSSHADVAKRAA